MVTATLNMAVEIRPIERKDKPEWKELFSGKDSYLVFYKSELPNDVIDTTFERFLDDHYNVWAAVAVDNENGKLIGFAHYLSHLNTWSTKDSIYLNDLFVSEASRLHGTGRKLIEYVYAQQEKLGCDRTYWMTQTHNHRAQLLYNKVGSPPGFVVYQR